MVRLFIVSDYESIHRKGGALSCYKIKNSSSPKMTNKKAPGVNPGAFLLLNVKVAAYVIIMAKWLTYCQCYFDEYEKLY